MHDLLPAASGTRKALDYLKMFASSLSIRSVQVSTAYNETDSARTVQSEWLTVLDEDDLVAFSDAAKPFENLAVVVDRKVCMYRHLYCL